jgi:predicted TIM-barrel fold metal-dependent hydrolase
MTHALKTLSRLATRSALFLLVIVAACNNKSEEKEQYYDVSDFGSVEKSDIHIHIFTDSPDFMEQARKDNFKVVNIALDAQNKMAPVREQFRFCEIQKKNNAGSVEIVTAFSMEGWDNPDWLDKNMAWLDSCFDRGAIGVKLWKNIGMVYRDKNDSLIMIDHPRLDPIFKMLAERKIPVIGHIGEPKNCWLPLEEMTTNNDRNYFRENPQYHMYQHPELPSYEEQIAARDRMLEKNPDLIFIGAHLGSLEWSVDELAKRLDRFPNMAVETAARMGQIFHQTSTQRDKVREFFLKYQDRVLYGSDMGASGSESKESLAKELHDTWMRDWRYFVTEDTLTSSLVNNAYQGLKLPRDVVDKIYYNNAVKWLGAFQHGSRATPVSDNSAGKHAR